MDIQTTKPDQTTLLVSLDGRLDTTTAPQLEKTLKTEIQDAQLLVFDFANLDYLSSAGLRVLLSAQKVMNRQGEMRILNVKEIVMEVFEITGFVDILTIE